MHFIQRTEAAGNQLDHRLPALEPVASDSCTEAKRAELRRVLLDYDYVQAIGDVADDHMPPVGRKATAWTWGRRTRQPDGTAGCTWRSRSTAAAPSWCSLGHSYAAGGAPGCPARRRKPRARPWRKAYGRSAGNSGPSRRLRSGAGWPAAPGHRPRRRSSTTATTWWRSRP
ncbi:CSS-motif domain-containing protein [Rhodanobacter lindaniclasticus]